MGMSDEEIHNLIKLENLVDDKATGVSFEWEQSGWLHVHGTQDYSSSRGVTSAKTPIHLDVGEYVISAEVEGGGLGTYVYTSIWATDDSKLLGAINPKTGYLTFSVAEPVDIYVWVDAAEMGVTVDYRMRLMLVYGTTPAAWAPADGETLSGGGASMSANLLDGVMPTLMSGTTESDGIWHHAASSGHYDLLSWDLAGQPKLATNQTYHVGLSVKGAASAAQSMWMAVGYEDGAGNRNWVHPWLPIGTSWGRAEGTLVVPSGMTPFGAYVTAYGDSPELWFTAPTLSYGSPVTLASDAHTPYATQDHVAAEYATKAALKVTSDAVTAEVTERGKLAGRVGTLESTSGTHTSKLEQLATSITSLVKGESTYTDPDGRSATSGIYSLVEQTKDSVTALFGSYTKTADLASTQAVKDAKAAGTAAQASIDGMQIGGRNLIVQATLLDGCRIGMDGAQFKDAYHSISDYIKVAPSASYTMSEYQAYEGGGFISVAFYDADKNFVSRPSGALSAAVLSKTYESPENAAYARVSFPKTLKSAVKFERGTKATDWTPAPEDTDSAVKDAKKAGTDAASAASAAQSTADTAKSNAATAQSTADAAKSAASKAQSTADGAKSTADGLATMIRQDADGVTVGKSADGKTWSTTRTRMGASAFEVLTKAGEVASSFGEKVIELGKNSQDAVIRMLGGLVTIKATSAGVSDGAWCEISTDEFVSMNGYHASRLAAGYKDESESAPQGVAEVMAQGGEGDGSVLLYAGAHGSDGNSLSLYPGGFTMNHPEYMLSALGLGSYGPVSPSSPYGSLTFCVRAGVATLWVSWGTTADPWGKVQCGEWVVPEAYRPRMDLNAPVALRNRGSGDTGDTRLVVEASTGKIYWQNLGGGHSATTFDALVSWGIE